MTETSFALFVLIAAFICFTVWSVTSRDACIHRHCNSSYAKPMWVRHQGCVCVEDAR